MIRRPPRSTLSSSSAASDVYKRQMQSPPAKPPKKSKPNPSQRYAFWLVPPTGSMQHAALQELIQRHSQSSFEPHVTLAAYESNDQDFAIATAQRLASTLPAVIRIGFSGVNTSVTYHQCVFLSACLLYTSPSPRDS
eukprot:TRINITY_DN30348_c0_g1_i2.p1 TRINITY_DN30348_c0_g1~~TRINITY_DN30348_c0_g1_i2.p1  ORF type:complete len:137 (+),score=27.95 TRINITY_DN30348_c0_g1_i2:142-552(+)